MPGEREPLTDEQRALAGDPAHLRVALSVARRWGRRCPRLRDEFLSAAGYALVVAASGFVPARAPKGFGGYLVLVVRSQCREAVRAARPLGYRRWGTTDAPAVAGSEGLDAGCRLL